MRIKQAGTHAHVVWTCACGKRNRTHVRIDRTYVVAACEGCEDGTADIIPPTVDVYAGSVGRDMRGEAS